MKKLFGITITAVCSAVVILAAVATGFYFGNQAVGPSPPTSEPQSTANQTADSEPVIMAEETTAEPEPVVTIEEATTKDTEPATTDANSIAIPGFEKIAMKARQLEQEVNFYNPQKNKCYFIVTLYLSDGTKIFRPGLIAPGKSINSIELLYTLEADTYEDTILRYSCYAIGDMQPLNGADITFTLEVKT